MGTGTAEFIATGLPALAVAVALYILFCICRCTHPDIYEPRTRKVMPEIEQLSQPSPPGFLQWMIPLMSGRLEDLARNSGTDAAARIAFQGTMAAIFLLLSVLAGAALLPIYATGGGYHSGFDQLSMTNLRLPGSWRHWTTAGVCWLSSLLAYLMIYLGLKLVASLQLAGEKRLCHLEHQVVVVTRIPEGSRSVTAVKSYFEERFPSSVLYAQPIKDMGKKHEKLLVKYVQAWRSWKKAEAKQQEKPDKKQTVKDGCLGLMGKKVEAIDYYKGKCAEYREQLEHGISHYDDIEGWSSAFVAFTWVRAAADAMNRLRPGKEWGCMPAPHPREICWSNMCKGRSVMKQFALLGLAGILVAAVIIAFMPTLAFAQAICNLEELSRSVPFLAWVQHLRPWIRGCLQGLLPVLVVLVLNALVIPIMELLADLSGAENYRVYHRRVMWYFFSHLVMNVFVILVLSSSLLNAVSDIIDDPARVSTLLGESVPKVSTFFMLYIMAQALGGAPGKLALLGKVIVGKLKLRCMAKTDYEREEAIEPRFDDFKVGVDYASDLFICVICMSYSMIAPLASLFGLLYFLLNIVTSKYLLKFYWKTSFDSGGALAVSAFRGACIGMMVGQLVVLFALALQDSPAAILVAPLTIASFLLAALLPHYGPGRTIMRQVPSEGLIAELEASGACFEARRRLEYAQAMHLWAQTSYAPNFDDPVHDRFNWAPCEIIDPLTANLRSVPPQGQGHGSSSTVEHGDLLGQL
mmetsp:Transcript_17582/g.50146  ORF Transcript_17582/g.50146 Transcript_17582/m.50146 type:complete len:749 (-) Transcript_17582:167-2413(-)